MFHTVIITLSSKQEI